MKAEKSNKVAVIKNNHDENEKREVEKALIDTKNTTLTLKQVIGLPASKDSHAS